MITLVSAIGFLVLWGVIALWVSWPTGWAHLPLAIAAVLFAKAVVDSGRPKPDRG